VEHCELRVFQSDICIFLFFLTLFEFSFSMTDGWLWWSASGCSG